MATAVAGTPNGAAPTGLPAKVIPIPPNQTLYVRDIPSAKLQKADIRMALYMLFSTYGPVLDVVALKTMKMRGQAHIVFRDVQSATQAMRSLEGFDFFGAKLKIEYAKSKSNIIAKLDGSAKLSTPSASTNVQVTELQQSIFNAPVPGAVATSTIPAKVTHGPPSKPATSVDQPMKDAGTADGGRGQKRLREEDEEEEEDSDVAMEEDSDEE